jgi:glucose uptake protein GlcU
MWCLFLNSHASPDTIRLESSKDLLSEMIIVNVILGFSWASEMCVLFMLINNSTVGHVYSYIISLLSIQALNHLGFF